MRTRFAGALVAALLALPACKNPSKSGLFSGPVLPTLAGDWNGTMSMGTSNPTMQMSLVQSNINIKGGYSAPTVSAAALGDSGAVKGLTTGQSFQMTFTATHPTGCVAHIDMNGYNSGDELAFNFSGVDCSSSPVSGQGYCHRP
jgi:hypothetical protein